MGPLRHLSRVGGRILMIIAQARTGGLQPSPSRHFTPPRVNTLLDRGTKPDRMAAAMNHITTFLKAHRAFLTRTFAVLFIAFSIAAASPVDALLDSIASQIEQRAAVERNYVNMATIQLGGTTQRSQEEVNVLLAIQRFYLGRSSAMVEIAAYLRSFKSEDTTPPLIP